MKIRCHIVDDEPLARERLRMLAAEEPDLEIIAESANANEALASLRREAPDVLFLDVQMPEIDGFGLLERLPPDSLPNVIFTTAFDQHAVRAFEARALDYLLKPIQPERFRTAVQRARELVSGQRETDTARQLLDLLADRRQQERHLSKLTIKTDDATLIIDVAEIIYVETAGNYVAVHVGKESHIMRDTLTNLEAQFDPAKFLRVSRAALVNLDHVTELQPMFKGEHIVVLRNGARLPLKRGLREMEQALKYS